MTDPTTNTRNRSGGAAAPHFAPDALCSCCQPAPVAWPRPASLAPDRSEAERFLALLDPGASKFTFQTFDDDKERKERRAEAGEKDPYAKVFHGTLAQHFDALARLNARGAGIFVTVNETDFRGRTIKNVVRVRSLFVDLDGSPLGPVIASLPAPHVIVDSSPGKWHAYWFVTGVALGDFTAMQKGLAARFGGDPSVHDLPRVMRLPGFFHRQGAPTMVHVTAVRDAAPWDASDFRELEAGEVDGLDPEQVARDAGKGIARDDWNSSPWDELNSAALANLGAWVPSLFKGKAQFQPGTGAWRVSSKALGRNLQEDLSLAPSGIKDWGVHDQGDEREGRRSPIDVVMEHDQKTFAEAVEWLREKLGNGHNYDSEGNDEESTNDGSAQARTNDQQQQAKPKKVLLPLIDMSSWDDEPVPQQEWAVYERIPTSHTTLFSGEGAAGKSLIQLQLSVATVIGSDWLGVVPKQGPALFVDAEDDVNIIHKRLWDITRHYGVKFADVKANLHVSSLSGKDAVLAFFNRSTSRIEPTPLYKELVEMARDLKPKIIGIASSANVFAGNEIDRSQVQQFIALLTRVASVANCAVTLISHPSLAGISTDSGLSGSTQWHNSVRARFYIKGLKAQNGEPEGDLRVIEFRKNNYGPISDGVIVQYKNGLFLPANTTEDRAVRDAEADDIYLTVLKILVSQNQDLSPKRKANNYAPTVICQHPRCLPGRFTRQEMEAAQQRLLDTRKIHVAKSDGPPSRVFKFVALGPGPDPNSAEEEPM